MIIPRKNSPLAGYTFNQIKSFIRNGQDWRKILPMYKENKVEKNTNSKVVHRIDPKFEMLKDKSPEEIRSMVESAKKYREQQDKNKTQEQRVTEKLELELQKARRMIKQMETQLRQKDQIIQSRENILGRSTIDRRISEAARKKGAPRPELILRDSELMKRISYNIDDNDIEILDKDGNISVGMTVDDLIEKHKEEIPEFYATFPDNSIGIAGSLGKKSDWRNRTPQEKIDQGLKEFVNS